MIQLNFNKLLGLKGSKIEKIKTLSIYHSTRLSELIANIYGFDMFRLNLNELSVQKLYFTAK
jgi:hypothetical protein